MKHLPSDINVDVILGMIPFERQLIERASEMCLGGVRIPIPTPEDMIIMKVIARRTQDLEDIRGIVDTNESLDRDYIRSAVPEFAIDLGVPEIATDLEGLL